MAPNTPKPIAKLLDLISCLRLAGSPHFVVQPIH